MGKVLWRWGGDWNSVSASHIRSTKTKGCVQKLRGQLGTGSPLEPSEGARPYPHFGVGLLSFRWWKDTFLLFKAIQFWSFIMAAQELVQGPRSLVIEDGGTDQAALKETKPENASSDLPCPPCAALVDLVPRALLRADVAAACRCVSSLPQPSDVTLPPVSSLWTSQPACWKWRHNPRQSCRLISCQTSPCWHAESSLFISIKHTCLPTGSGFLFVCFFPFQVVKCQPLSSLKT